MGLEEAPRNELLKMYGQIGFLGLTLAFCIVSNLSNLNHSMSMFSQLHVLPIYESCCIFFNLISGGLILGEFALYTREQLCYIMFGCLLSISGILFKMLYPVPQDGEDVGSPDLKASHCSMDQHFRPATCGLAIREPQLSMMSNFSEAVRDSILSIRVRIERNNYREQSIISNGGPVTYGHGNF